LATLSSIFADKVNSLHSRRIIKERVNSCTIWNKIIGKENVQKCIVYTRRPTIVGGLVEGKHKPGKGNFFDGNARRLKKLRYFSNKYKVGFTGNLRRIIDWFYFQKLSIPVKISA